MEPLAPQSRLEAREEPGPDTSRDSRTIKQQAADDRPQERALKYGIASLSNADLFALILRTGQPGNPINALCRDLMEAIDNSLFALERRTREELMEIKGVGVTKALQIEAVMELIRRYNMERVEERPVIDNPAKIYDILRPRIGNLSHEEIWAVFLDNGNRVIDKRRITEGGAKASVFDIKKLMRVAMLINAEAIALAHNHPSEMKRPSPQDTELTRRLLQACRTMEIRFVDHLIVTADGYFSYATETTVLS